MIDNNEMIVKSVGKIDFVEMKMLVAAELTQTRNNAGYILKREVKLKAIWASLRKIFTKKEISFTWKLFSTYLSTLLKKNSIASIYLLFLVVKLSFKLAF